jgi:hypothetical protein
MAWAIAGLTLGVSACTTSPSSSPVKRVPESPWLHPKAHAWIHENNSDVASLISDIQLVYGYMEICSATTFQLGACSPENQSAGSDPGKWPVRTSIDCQTLLSAVSTVRADGPIPDTATERYWSTALSDDEDGCNQIVAAQQILTADTQNGLSGPDLQAEVPGEKAAQDFTSAGTLLQRVGNFLDAKRPG